MDIFHILFAYLYTFDNKFIDPTVPITRSYLVFDSIDPDYIKGGNGTAGTPKVITRGRLKIFCAYHICIDLYLSIYNSISCVKIVCN